MEAVEAATRVEEIVRRAVDRLRERIRIQQVILFGSHARREADPWSDVDLAVISPDFGRMSHRKIMDLLVEVALAVDASVEIRPYTPNDVKDARPTNFLGHILAEGRVVYKHGEFLLSAQPGGAKALDRWKSPRRKAALRGRSLRWRGAR